MREPLPHYDAAGSNTKTQSGTRDYHNGNRGQARGILRLPLPGKVPTNPHLFNKIDKLSWV